MADLAVSEAAQGRGAGRELLERVKHESGPEVGVVVLLGIAAGGGGGFLRTGKDGMGEELFCASAGGGRVGGPETSHGASGDFGNGAGDGLVRPRGLLGFGFGLCSWVV